MPTQRKKQSTKKRAAQPASGPFGKLLGRFRRKRAAKMHASFRLTRRRDYLRTVQLPGYLVMTREVTAILWRNKRIMVSLIAILSLLVIILTGLSSNLTYQAAREYVTSDTAQLSGVAQVGLLSISALTEAGTALSDVQQVYIGVIALLGWLVTIWLLRELYAGNTHIRLRDGLYNAGAPIVSTTMVLLVLLAQFIPLAIVTLLYSSLTQAELITAGLGSFLFTMLIVVVVALTLYWVTSTMFALVIVTLPGMYPRRALRSASDVVLSRRLQIMLRVIWLLVVLAFIGFAMMLPTVLVDNFIATQWGVTLPIVSIVATIFMTVAVVWGASYIYILYRKVVAHDAAESR